MARTSNLTDFLTDVAAAIKEKKGSATAIPAANFDTEILNLPSQGVYETRTINIAQNGQQIITPNQDFDAIEELTINVQVPEAQLQTKNYSFTQNTTTTLTPESGYDGFSSVGLTINVQGTDLSPELNTQDELISDIKSALNGRKRDVVNIFAQTTQPDIKKGIWFNTSNEVDEIIEDFNIFGSEQWNTTKTNSLRTMPFNFNGHGAVRINEYIYLFSSSKAYKYNIATDTYTQLSTPPITFSSDGTSFAAIETDIYVFGYTTNSYDTYKYNTINDTWTKMATKAPYYFFGGGACTVGTNIYIFGGFSSAVQKYAFRYNPSNDSYTQLANIPFAYDRSGTIAAVGNYIYIFSSTQTSSSARSKMYRYNISANSYTSRTDVPYPCFGGAAVAVGNNIYLYGSRYTDSTTYQKYTYKYNISSNTYTKLSNASYSCQSSGAVFDGTNIYVFSGTKVQVMSMVPKTYTNKSIVIANNDLNTYRTVLVDSEVVNGLQYEFNDAFYYTTANGFDTTIPTYYGNGTSWIKFKN